MHLERETVGIDEAAAALARSPDWLKRNWLKMHERHGFPRKLPGCWVWPRAALQAWLRGGGASAAQPATANDNATRSVDAAYRAALDQRYGATE